jgi:hypothetical protein
VLKFPCNYQSNQFFTNPLGCSGEGCNLETSASCGATFRCRSAGTYTLQLTMSDGCSTTSDTVPVVCKCANQISADVMSPQVVVLKTCDGASKTRMFPTMDILGSYTQIPQRAGAALPACPAAPAPAAATAAPVAPVATGQCCPAPAACPAWYDSHSFFCRPFPCFNPGLLFVQHPVPSMRTVPIRSRCSGTCADASSRRCSWRCSGSSSAWRGSGPVRPSTGRYSRLGTCSRPRICAGPSGSPCRDPRQRAHCAGTDPRHRAHCASTSSWLSS